jgi:hypothetical protein
MVAMVDEGESKKVAKAYAVLLSRRSKELVAFGDFFSSGSLILGALMSAPHPKKRASNVAAAPRFILKVRECVQGYSLRG